MTGRQYLQCSPVFFQVGCWLEGCRVARTFDSMQMGFFDRQVSRKCLPSLTFLNALHVLCYVNGKENWGTGLAGSTTAPPNTRGDEFTLRCLSAWVISTNPLISTGINKATSAIQQKHYLLAGCVPLSADTLELRFCCSQMGLDWNQ